MGYLLNFFREDGWTTIGIDPNVGLCIYARNTLGLTVNTPPTVKHLQITWSTRGGHHCSSMASGIAANASCRSSFCAAVQA
jgi:hypothetical protein